MLKYKEMPKQFWAEAVSVAVHVRNHVTSRDLSGNVTPHEMWTGNKPNVSYLRVFGSRCWYRIPKRSMNKLNPRAKEAILVGYASHEKGYKLWDEESRRIFFSRDVKFDECGASKTKQLDSERVSSDENLDISSHLDDSIDKKLSSSISLDSPIAEASADSSNTVESEPTAEEGAETVPVQTVESTAARRSSRVRNAPGDWWKGASALISTGFADPRSFHEAVQHPEARLWMKASKEEYSSLMENDAWKLVPRPSNHNVVSCRWLFKTKEQRRQMDLCTNGTKLVSLQEASRKLRVSITRRRSPLW